MAPLGLSPFRLCAEAQTLRQGRAILAHLNHEVAPSFEAQEKYSALPPGPVGRVADLMTSEVIFCGVTLPFLKNDAFIIPVECQKSNRSPSLQTGSAALAHLA